MRKRRSQRYPPPFGAPPPRPEPQLPGRCPPQRWPWLLGLLVAVAIVGVATGGDTAGTSSLAPVTGESAPSAVPIEGLSTAGGHTLPGLGDPVRDGALEFVVDDVHAVSARQCAVVSLTVRNVADRPVRFDPTLLSLYAADGRPLATEAIAPTDLAVPAELAAGAELDTAVGFLETGAMLPAFVDLRQSVFSPGVRVSAS
ncbi:MAG TPA: hypothetical protein VIW24_09850 [Aldersonia sp.]